MPKISVLMPVYKTNEKFLREAIESILKQTFDDFEFLILDDCPEDSREKVVKSYKDKRIKYYKNEKNLGITPTRNKLIDLAKGEYLAIMDHDDIRLPESFSEEVKVLDNHPNIGVVGSAIHKIVKNKDVFLPEYDEDIKVALMAKCAVTHPSSMVRRSLLVDNHIYYEEHYSPAEDYRLWSRLIDYTDFYNIPKVLFCYRDWRNNTTHIQDDKMNKAGAEISAENMVKYPVLERRFSLSAKHIDFVRLFGFIPFLKIVTQGNRRKTYLFNSILLYTAKKSTKL